MKQQIQKLGMRWTDDEGIKSVRALAEVSHSDGRRQVVSSTGAIFDHDPIDSVQVIVETQLADLREKLYAAGFSELEVATAEDDPANLCDDE